MARFRAFAFRLCFFLWTAAVATLTLPWLLGPRRWGVAVQRFWAKSTLHILRIVGGVTHEIRGHDRLPSGPVLIASKHQSAWDTIIFLLEDFSPAFVFKKELLRIPVYGWYCLRTGMVPIDREGGALALRSMIRGVHGRLEEGRSVVIFPEGTRVRPGERKGYQPGIAGLYKHLKLPVVPVALNSGLIWPRSGLQHAGCKITLEYLEPIPPGLPKEEFLARLEQDIETATNRLVAEGRVQLAGS